MTTWKEVWGRPVYPSWMMVSLAQETQLHTPAPKFHDPIVVNQLPVPQGGITYGQHVAALVLSGGVSVPFSMTAGEDYSEKTPQGIEVASAIEAAKELCKQLAEMEGEG